MYIYVTTMIKENKKAVEIINKNIAGLRDTGRDTVGKKTGYGSRLLNRIKLCYKMHGMS